MPRTKKSKLKQEAQIKPLQQTEQEKSKFEPKLESSDYEQNLIDKISKCQRIVEGLESNPIWNEIKADYENTAKGLDMAWAFEATDSPRFKQMQASKMAVQTFMNLLPSYKHDLELARKQLEVFRNPKNVIKKDYDDEGTVGTQTVSSVQGNAYHE
jgi:hypothetical protein